jgi:hypothetical protein
VLLGIFSWKRSAPRNLVNATASLSYGLVFPLAMRR